MDQSHSEKMPEDFSDLSIAEINRLLNQLDINDDLQAKIRLNLIEELKNRDK